VEERRERRLHRQGGYPRGWRSAPPREGARHAEARAKAEDMVKRARSTRTRTSSPRASREEKGLVLDGELLIPMREFSLYRRSTACSASQPTARSYSCRRQGEGLGVLHRPDGAERALARRGLCHRPQRARSAARAAPDAQVIVCFSAGNLAHVGTHGEGACGRRLSSSRITTRAAPEPRPQKKPACRGCMAPEEGMDANDCTRFMGCARWRS
jgi:hypothetical protein